MLPLTDPPIYVTIDQQVCWVCGRRFIEEGGTDPAVIRNRHHVCPRANGGENGPTVTLCSAHHDLLHAVAEQALSNKPYEHLLKGLLPRELKTIRYLAGVVVNSTRLIADDPNKRGQVSVVFDGETDRMLSTLAKAGRTSRAKTLIALIRKEHQRLFPTIPT